MTERINGSTATITGTSFSPTGDFSAQVAIPPGTNARLDVEARADTAADWQIIGSIIRTSVPLIVRTACTARLPVISIRPARSGSSC